jgi:hypothetical protein
MIKLINILKELEKPSQVYTTTNPPEEDFIQKGFKLGKPEINPETGSTTTTVTYLPKFKQMRVDLIQKRNNIKPFKFSANPDIVKVATEADRMIGKLSQLIFALDKMIELQQKGQ